MRFVRFWGFTAFAATIFACAALFASCEQQVSTSATATYVYTMEESEVYSYGGLSVTAGGVYTIFFYDDGTYVYHSSSKMIQESESVSRTIRGNLDVSAGTYTGDPTADGDVVITPTKAIDSSTFQDVLTKEIEAGSTDITITNSQVPLVSLSDLSDEQTLAWEETTLHIQDGSLTYTVQSEYGSGRNTFTRQ